MLVPEEWLTRKGNLARYRDGSRYVPGRYRDHLPVLIARAERAEERADEANKRADVAVVLADRTLGPTRRVRTPWADRAEAGLSAERTHSDALRDLHR